MNIEPRITGILRKQKRAPISLKELMKKAGVNKNDKAAAMEILLRLENENKVIEQNGKFVLVENLGLITAEIVKVNATFGFARPDAGDRDVFIPGRMLLGAMPGDVVLMKQKNRSGDLPEGEVLRVIRESEQKFSGILEVSDDGDGFVVVSDRYVKFPLRLERRSCKGLNAGDKVLARISRRGTRHSGHVAEIVSGFGDASKASACCASILAAHDISTEFPLDVLEQAKAIGAGHGIHPKELAVREDLRGDIIFTIDGADTKDIDDAISLKKTLRGWELGVHIADVSYYVTYKTPIDNEAFVRGTSVYFADSVVPMLPKELSNGICSLNPNEDRLAFSAIIQLDENAKITSYEFKKTVIRSRVKGVYHEINKLLDNTADLDIASKYADFKDMLLEMDMLAKKLSTNRFNRGGVSLESVESKIIVGEDGSPVDIVPRERGVSEMMIEEFMLVANEAAARLAIKEGLPFVFRVHESPAPDKLEMLFAVLEKLGVRFKRPKGKVTSDQLNAILGEVKDSELMEIVNSMVLRSMAKAKYSEHNIGHFGLALDDYTHFTSPIRRYPDLTIHRILSSLVTGMRKDNINKRFGVFAPQSAARSTAREIAAMTAERDCTDAYKAEYMAGHIGEEYVAAIASVTQFGFYARLDNTVEGLVRIESLPSGDWQYDGYISLTDTLSENRFQLGDKIRVRVLSADVSAGHVDFGFVNTIPRER